jgi:hypothetical protein
MILSHYPVLQAMRLQSPWPFDAVKRSMPRLLLDHQPVLIELA